MSALPEVAGGHDRARITRVEVRKEVGRSRGHRGQGSPAELRTVLSFSSVAPFCESTA